MRLIIFIHVFFLLFSCVRTEEKELLAINIDNWQKDFANQQLRIAKQYKIGYSGEETLNQYIEFDSLGNVIYSKSLFVECSEKSDTIVLSSTDTLNLNFIGHFNLNNELIVLKSKVNDTIDLTTEFKDTVFYYSHPPFRNGVHLIDFKILALKTNTLNEKPVLAGPEITLSKIIIVQ